MMNLLRTRSLPAVHHAVRPPTWGNNSVFRFGHELGTLQWRRDPDDLGCLPKPLDLASGSSFSASFRLQLPVISDTLYESHLGSYVLLGISSLLKNQAVDIIPAVVQIFSPPPQISPDPQISKTPTVSKYTPFNILASKSFTALTSSHACC